MMLRTSVYRSVIPPTATLNDQRYRYVDCHERRIANIVCYVAHNESYRGDQRIAVPSVWFANDSPACRILRFVATHTPKNGVGWNIAMMC